MCLRAYLNGDGTGRGTHLSLFFVLMRGPHDALLRWPFNQKVRGAAGRRVASVAARPHGAWRAASESLCARAAGSRAEAGTRVWVSTEVRGRSPVALAEGVVSPSVGRGPASPWRALLLGRGSWELLRKRP